MSDSTSGHSCSAGCGAFEGGQVGQEAGDAAAGGEDLAWVQQAVRVENRFDGARQRDGQSTLSFFQELTFERAHAMLAAQRATQPDRSAENVARGELHPLNFIRIAQVEQN